MHLVAYLNYLTPPYEMSICSYGLMGTYFVRDEVLPATLEVYQGETSTMTIPHIYSGIEIGTIMLIDLRHETGAEIPFVTFENETGSTKV